MFNWYDEKKKNSNDSDAKGYNKTSTVTNENAHQKITFDEDF